jgi:hypothetical protein
VSTKARRASAPAICLVGITVVTSDKWKLLDYITGDGKPRASTAYRYAVAVKATAAKRKAHVAAFEVCSVTGEVGAATGRSGHAQLSRLRQQRSVITRGASRDEQAQRSDGCNRLRGSNLNPYGAAIRYTQLGQTNEGWGCTSESVPPHTTCIYSMLARFS